MGTSFFESVKTLNVGTSNFKKFNFEKGEVICNENEPYQGAFVLVKGSARAIIRSNKHEVQVSNYKENQIFCLSSLLEGKNKNQLTVKATELCEVLFIPTKTFLLLLKEKPTLWQSLLTSLSQEIISIKNTLKISVVEN